MGKLSSIFSKSSKSSPQQPAQQPAQSPQEPAMSSVQEQQPAAPSTETPQTTKTSKVGGANISTDQFLEAASYRRTVYPLKGTSAVSDQRVEEIVQKVLSFAPSSYNTQPDRIVIATGEKHKQVWEIITNESEPILKGAGEDVWNMMKGRFDMFKASYGSILFFDRQETIKESGETHKSVAHMFDQWAEHATGMHQIMVWTALELEGLGASLQHLNAIPPVEAALKKFAGLPDDYKLKAHLVYGDEAAEHPKKPEKLPFSETLKVL